MDRVFCLSDWSMICLLVNVVTFSHTASYDTRDANQSILGFRKRGQGLKLMVLDPMD